MERLLSTGPTLSCFGQVLGNVFLQDVSYHHTLLVLSYFGLDLGIHRTYLSNLFRISFNELIKYKTKMILNILLRDM